MLRECFKLAKNMLDFSAWNTSEKNALLENSTHALAYNKKSAVKLCKEIENIFFALPHFDLHVLL